MSTLPDVDVRTLQHAFAKALADVPGKVAYICGEEAVTYADMHRQALRAGAMFDELGVGVGESVALLLDNSIDMLRLVFGAALTGRVVVPINTAYRGDILVHVLNNCGASVIVLESGYLERVTDVVSACDALGHLIVRGPVDAVVGRDSAATYRVASLKEFGAGRLAEPVDPDPAAPMALMYTSGTTGLSKGVQVTHAHFYTYASREDSPQPRDDDRILVTLPLFHFSGIGYGAYQSLIARATCVIEPGFSVSKFWPTVRRHRITETFLLGVMVELLSGAPAQPDDRDNTLAFAPTAPMPREAGAFERRFDLRVGAVYGLSEVGSVMRSDPPNVVPGEVGFLREDYEACLTNEDGSDAGDGPGELRIRPRSSLIVMQGYQGMADATEKTLRDGWAVTGDVLRRDREGHYFFVDRKKDALRRRGENISSFEVERALTSHPSVLEAAVVGVPSDISEDEIKAIFTCADDTGVVDFVDLTRHLVRQLPYFMVPRYFEVVPAMPKTPTGKIMKDAFRGSGLGTVTWDRVAAGIEVHRGTTPADI